MATNDLTGKDVEWIDDGRRKRGVVIGRENGMLSIMGEDDQTHYIYASRCVVTEEASDDQGYPEEIEEDSAD